MTQTLSLGNSRINGAAALRPWLVRMWVRDPLRRPRNALAERSERGDRNLATLKMRSTDPMSANSNNSNANVSHAVSASHGWSRPSLCVLPRYPDSHAAGSCRTHRYRDRGVPRRRLRRVSVHHDRKARRRGCRNHTVYGSGGLCCEAIHTPLGGEQSVYVAVDDGMK